jgi:hypothetical protein
MSKKKPTAVEWLYNELFYFLNAKSKFEDADEILDKAKEMEKQQIVKGVNFGTNQWVRLGVLNGEEYYNKTYGGNK